MFICEFQIFSENIAYFLCTGLFISFKTLEMNCLWQTGSSQIFFEKIPNEKKVSSPNYLKILMKLNKNGISYSLRRDPRSISKITFYANLIVNPIDIKH